MGGLCCCCVVAPLETAFYLRKSLQGLAPTRPPVYICIAIVQSLNVARGHLGCPCINLLHLICTDSHALRCYDACALKILATTESHIFPWINQATESQHSMDQPGYATKGAAVRCTCLRPGFILSDGAPSHCAAS